MRRVSLLALLAFLSASLWPIHAGAYTNTGKLEFGFPNETVPFVESQERNGQRPQLGYGSVWAENYAIEHDYSNIRQALQRNRADGVKPMIMWYYWGDKISKTCVENWNNTSLCDRGKTREKWMAEGRELANVIEQEMGTSETVVVVEPEFHKDRDDLGCCESTNNLESLDGYLAEQVNIFNAKAAIRTVIGYGEWVSDSTLTTYDRATGAAHYVGTQILFSCIRQTYTSYSGAVSRIITNGGRYNSRWPAKPVFVYDFATSSYSGQSTGDPAYWTTTSTRDCKTPGDYELHQETEVQEVFDRITDLKNAGVVGFVFRALNDHVNRDPDGDYHRIAERWFGYRRVDNGVVTEKRGYDNLIAGLIANDSGGGDPPPPPPPPPPPTGDEWAQEVELFPYKANGQQTTDPNASNGAYWNLWSNGHVETTMSVPSSGTRQIRIRARGDDAAGVWPLMRVVVDGSTVSEQTVASATYQTYTAAVYLNSGSRVLQIHFLNDAIVNGEDRNLKLDVASFRVAPDTWSHEAELFSSRPVGGLGTDTSASGGAYWNIWSNGTISQSFSVPVTAGYAVRVKARGDVAGGIWPTMKVTIGTRTKTYTVNSGSWVTYSEPWDLAAGTHTIQIQFTNDGIVGGEDRNLKVDVASIKG